MSMCDLCKSAEKISNMGDARRRKVASITRDAVKRRFTVGGLARKLKKEANTPTGKDDRDWLRVAQTEITDMSGRVSLDDLIDKHGPTVRVFRITREACPICRKAFGDPSAPKLWRAGAVPDNLKGALHPNCRCKPWSIGEVRIVKSERDTLVGDIEMTDKGPRIFTYMNRWNTLDSVDGLKTIEDVILSTPALATETSVDGYIRGWHGYSKSNEKQIMFDITKVPGAYVIPASVDTASRIEGEAAKRLAQVCSMTIPEYVSVMKKLLPVIVVMPEFWKKKTVRHLSGFFGYGTRTDFIIVAPLLPKEALSGTIEPEKTGVRRAVRDTTVAALG